MTATATATATTTTSALPTPEQAARNDDANQLTQNDVASGVGKTTTTTTPPAPVAGSADPSTGMKPELISSQEPAKSSQLATGSTEQQEVTNRTTTKPSNVLRRKVSVFSFNGFPNPQLLDQQQVAARQQQQPQPQQDASNVPSPNPTAISGKTMVGGEMNNGVGSALPPKGLTNPAASRRKSAGAEPGAGAAASAQQASSGPVQAGKNPSRSMRSDTLGSTGSSRASSCDEPTIIANQSVPSNPSSGYSSANSINSSANQAAIAQQQTATAKDEQDPSARAGPSDNPANPVVVQRKISSSRSAILGLSTLSSSTSSLDSIAWSTTSLGARMQPQQQRKESVRSDKEAATMQIKQMDGEDEEDDEDEEPMEVSGEIMASSSMAMRTKQLNVQPFEPLREKLKRNSVPNPQLVSQHIDDIISQNEAILDNWNHVSIRPYNSSNLQQQQQQTNQQQSYQAPAPIQRPTKRWSINSFHGSHFPINISNNHLSGDEQPIITTTAASTTTFNSSAITTIPQTCDTQSAQSFIANKQQQQQQAQQARYQAQPERKRSYNDMKRISQEDDSSMPAPLDMQVPRANVARFLSEHGLTSRGSCSLDPAQLESEIQSLSLKRDNDDHILQEQARNLLLATRGADIMHSSDLMSQDQYFAALLNQSNNNNNANTNLGQPIQQLEQLHHQMSLDSAKALLLRQHHHQQQHLSAQQQQLIEQELDRMRFNQLIAAALERQQQEQHRQLQTYHHHQTTFSNNNLNQRQHPQQQQQQPPAGQPWNERRLSRLRQMEHGSEMLTHSLDSATPSHRCDTCDISFWTNDLLNYHKLTQCVARSSDPSGPIAFNFAGPNNYDNAHLSLKPIMSSDHSSNKPSKSVSPGLASLREDADEGESARGSRLDLGGDASSILKSQLLFTTQINDAPATQTPKTSSLPFKKRKISEPIMRYSGSSFPAN